MNYRRIGIFLFFILCSVLAVVIFIRWPIRIDCITKKTMELSGVDGSKMIHFGGYNSIGRTAVNICISEDDIQKYIDSLLDDNAKRIEIKDRKDVRDGDLVIADYTCTIDDRVVSDEKNIPIRVGKGYHDPELEKRILGLAANNTYELEWIITTEGEESAGLIENVHYHICLKKLYSISIPTIEEYARDNGYSNAKELYDEAHQTIYNARRNQKISEITEEFYKRIASDSMFILDEDEIAKNAVEYYYDYESYAKMYGVEISTYLSNVLDYHGDIYTLCYEESKASVEKQLVVGRIAYENGFEVSNEELIEYLNEVEKNQDSISDEDKVYISYYLLEKKVSDYLTKTYIFEE